MIERETDLAKQMLQAGSKAKALLFLKKKKYQEQLLEQTDAQLINLEQLTHSIEYALVEKELLDGIRHGNQVLNAIHKETSLEDVERLMHDTADAIAYQNDIERMLGGALSSVDEDDLLQDLESMIEQQTHTQEMEKPVLKESKSAPQTEPQAKKERPVMLATT